MPEGCAQDFRWMERRQRCTLKEICCSTSVDKVYWGIEALVRLFKFVSEDARCVPCLTGRGVDE